MERARTAYRSDLARLVELCDEAIAEVSSRRGGQSLIRAALGHATVPERLMEALEDPTSLVVVGELAGAPMGVGVVEVGPQPVEGRTASVVVLFVEHGCRGVGVGEVLMDAMAGWSLEQGCAGIDAMALPGSREAKAFFETHGLIARALVMHRPLTAAVPAIAPAVAPAVGDGVSPAGVQSEAPGDVHGGAAP